MKFNHNDVVKCTFSTPRKQVYIFIVCLLAFPHVQACLQSNAYENEKNILLEMKQLWGNHSAFESWSSNSSYCNWFGVDCRNGSVKGISLQGQRLTGTIPPIVCGLKSLEVIQLPENNIRGEFPTYLCYCSKLKLLDLSWNQFQGPLPSDLHSLSKLVHLDIAENNFIEIPGTMGQLSELQYLPLKFNSFNNLIPREVGNLSNLVIVDISFESFTQAIILEELGRLKKLKDLIIAGSNSIGAIPETFSALSGLQTLDLSFNRLNGSIPSYLFYWKDLTSLHLQYNQFSGRLPALVANLEMIVKSQGISSSLELLDLSGNHLNGLITSYLFLFEKLDTLYLQENQFSGSLPIIAGKLRLQTLDLSSNQLSGYIPQEYDKNYHFFSSNHNLCSHYITHYIQVQHCSRKTRVAIAIVAPIAFLLTVAISCYLVKKWWNLTVDQFKWRNKRHENQDPE